MKERKSHLKDSEMLIPYQLIPASRDFGQIEWPVRLVLTDIRVGLTVRPVDIVWYLIIYWCNGSER